MKEQIEAVFAKCMTNQCIEEYREPQFWIHDPKGNIKCVIHLEKQEKFDFEVINKEEKLINFLAIDQCILDDTDGTKCDLALFDDTTFCFVEIKNARKNKGNHRNKALKQLGQTITLFKEKLEMANYALEARVCFSSSKTFPRLTAQRMVKIKRFQDQFGARLTEGNQKVFS